MLPMNHHKTRSQSSPRTPKHGCQPSGLPRFTIEDALLQVTLGELKTREAIRIVISLAANDCLTQESSESLGAIATEAGYSKADNPYDRQSQRKLFAAFERGLKVGLISWDCDRKLANSRKQKKTNKPKETKAVRSPRRRRLH